jgi:hypothetical protein
MTSTHIFRIRPDLQDEPPSLGFEAHGHAVYPGLKASNSSLQVFDLSLTSRRAARICRYLGVGGGFFTDQD